MHSTSAEVLLILEKNYCLKRKTKGGFRGWVDECVDGGILIGVIWT